MKGLLKVIACSLLLIVIGCEDSTSSSGSNAIESVEKIGQIENTCHKENKGALTFVESTNTLYFCNGSSWVASGTKDTVYVKSDTVFMHDTLVLRDSVFLVNVDTVMFAGLDGSSCTMTGEIDTTDVTEGISGHKIYCADTLTTVLWNGARGKDGLNGTDGLDGLNGSNGRDGKDGQDGENCTAQDNGSGVITLTCGATKAVVYMAVCGQVPYDPAQKTCYNSKLMERKVGWDYLNSQKYYYEFIDERDGQPYKVQIIGKQTWMAENLNYADSNWSVGLKGNTFCYRDSCQKYGRLYNYTAILDSAKLNRLYGIDCGPTSKYSGCKSMPTSVWQGICPEGFRLPNQTDWKTLLDYTGTKTEGIPTTWNSAKELITKNGWKGSTGIKDNYGFSALPTSWCLQDRYCYGGNTALYWLYDMSNSLAMKIDYSSTKSEALLEQVSWNYYMAVRCIKKE